jgi:hypothetical protein
MNTGKLVIMRACGFCAVITCSSHSGRRVRIAGGLIIVLLCGCRIPSVPTHPDLLVSAVNVPSSAVAAAATWELGATVVNTGTAAAAESSLEYWYSSDGALDAGDVLIGTHQVPALSPGSSCVDTWSATYAVADSGGGSGSHRIFVVADAGGVVPESDEANNTRSAAVAVLYDRIIIDTYRPKNGVIVANTFASLFGPAGDPTAETGTALWNDDVAPFTRDAPPISIAEADEGNPSFGSARIDYTGGLAPGTYYVRVRGQKSTTEGVYAVRVLLAPDEDYTAWYFVAISADADNEIDDNPPSGGVPASPVATSIGGKLNRALTPGDVDWLVFTLP